MSRFTRHWLVRVCALVAIIHVELFDRQVWHARLSLCRALAINLAAKFILSTIHITTFIVKLFQS
jgi:hypothetical protein